MTELKIKIASQDLNEKLFQLNNATRNEDRTNIQETDGNANKY